MHRTLKDGWTESMVTDKWLVRISVLRFFMVYDKLLLSVSGRLLSYSLTIREN